MAFKKRPVHKTALDVNATVDVCKGRQRTSNLAISDQTMNNFQTLKNLLPIMSTKKTSAITDNA